MGIKKPNKNKYILFLDIPYLIGYNVIESWWGLMTREFIIMPEFEKQWKNIGLSDGDLKTLQEELTLDPKKGDVIKGTGGLRKIRFAFEGKGKSGSVRVCYIDFENYQIIFLITAYSKSEKDNLSQAERNNISKLVKLLEKQIIERRKE